MFQLRLNQIMSSRAPGWIHIKLLQAAGWFWFMCPNKPNATVLNISNSYHLSPLWSESYVKIRLYMLFSEMGGRSCRAFYLIDSQRRCNMEMAWRASGGSSIKVDRVKTISRTLLFLYIWCFSGQHLSSETYVKTPLDMFFFEILLIN